jgi:DNA replication protein DnaC
MTEDQKASAEFMSRLDALIAAAPDDEDMPAETPQMPATPVLPPPRVNTPLIDFPDRHKRDLTLYGDEWRAAYEKALGIAESGGIIVAYGNRGTGKTQIAYEIAINARFPDRFFPSKKQDRYTIDGEPRAAIYKKAMRIFLELKAGFNRPDKPSECEVIDTLVNAAFLVIDEAHVRGESKYEDDKLTHIIDERYDAMRPTMLVTNLTNKDFAAQLSPSIISRIQEIGGGIECNWQSYRKQTK